MSSPDPHRRPRAVSWKHALLALAAALTLGGCFQPLYGTATMAGNAPLRDRMQGVDILPVEAPLGSPLARIGVEIRNNLSFGLTGGAGTHAATHRLRIALVPTRQSAIVDTVSGRTDIEDYGLDAAYSLIDLSTGKVAVQGSTFARVSYNIPGQVQRYARARGLRDAEDRAAAVVAENITRRLASFFVTGG